MNELSENFEPWNIDDESNSPIKINMPHETIGFTNILQINKGYAHHANDEIKDFRRSFWKLDLNDVSHAYVLEINDGDNSNQSKSSDSEENIAFLFSSNLYQPKVRGRRSQDYSDLLQSNIWDKYWRETPSIEILSKIMPS